MRRLCLCRGFESQPHRMGPHLEFAFHKVFHCVCTLHLALIGNGSGEGQVLPRKDCFGLGLFEDSVEMLDLAGCWKRKVIK